MTPKKGIEFSPNKGIDMSYMHIRNPRQILSANDFTERGVKFITRRPDIGLLAELTEPMRADEQKQLKAFMATVNILADAKARSRAVRGVV